MSILKLDLVPHFRGIILRKYLQDQSICIFEKAFLAYSSLRQEMEKAAFIDCQKWDSLSECQGYMCYSDFVIFKGINMVFTI